MKERVAQERATSLARISANRMLKVFDEAQDALSPGKDNWIYLHAESNMEDVRDLIQLIPLDMLTEIEVEAVTEMRAHLAEIRRMLAALNLQPTSTRDAERRALRDSIVWLKGVLPTFSTQSIKLP
jgi:hypothetical protein